MMRNRSNRSRHWLPMGCALALITSGLIAANPDQDRQPPTSPPTTNRAGSEANETPDNQADLAGQKAREQLTSGLIGGKHDFTEGGKSGRDLCLACHAPHLLAAPAARLDRRTSTTQPLRPYEGPGIELTSWSLLCLGCHDGITARDVFSSAHAVTVTGRMSDTLSASIAKRSHPVGVRYPMNNVQFEPLATVEASGMLLPDGRIQCTTCHDAHNTHRVRGMLRMSNSRSRLCLKCHRL